MKPIYCLLFLFVFTITFPQQKNTVIEDDYEILKEKIRLYFNASVDRSLVYAEQMAKSTNYEHLAFANGAMASLLQTKGETEKSKEKYKLALGYLVKMPDSKEKKRVTADVYNYGGLAEWYRGNHAAALEIFQSGIKVSSQIGDIKQIVKFKANIALLNESVGNYQLAIKNDREIIDFVNKNENLFTSAELLNRRSNVYLGLGSAYESYYIDKRRMKLLDSSEYFYKKAIEYSGNFPYTEATSRLSLGNIASWRKDYKSAERIYFDVVNLALKNKQFDLLSSAYYNLGDLFQSNGEYRKALPFLKKTDSLQVLYHSNAISYLRSNFYQARIYNELDMPELAHKHSRIFLDLFDKLEGKLNDERVKVNYKQGEDNLTAEMLSIEKKYKKDLFFSRSLNVFYVILSVGIIFYLIKNLRNKNKIHKKIIHLIAENRKNKRINNQSVAEIITEKKKKNKANGKRI